jgi:hypothetical protein
MSKSRNPGYVGGDHWETCDRCGQAFRSSQMKTQWDGLRVCQKDYDTRHQQDAVRETGSGCGTGPGGAGLDWNWGGGGYKPDLDPTTFIQEPNDAYFTNPPDGNFGSPSIPDYCVPNDNGFDCSTLTYEYPLHTWHMANDSRDQLGFATSNLREDSAGAQGEVCDGEVRYIYDTCYYGGGVGAPINRMDGAGTTKPTWVCDAAESKDGDLWPSIKMTGDQYFTGGALATYDEIFANQDNSEKPFGFTWIFVLQNVDVTTETTIIKTSDSTSSDSRNINTEGIRIYPQPDGTAKVGFHIPYQSRFNPGNDPSTTNAQDVCVSCQGTCWATSGGQPVASDIDIYWFDIEANETFMFRVDWYEDQVVVKKNSGVQEYQGSPYLSLEDADYNCTTKFVRGGYLPPSCHIHQYSSPKTTFEFLEAFSLVEEGHDRVLSTDKETVEEYLSWKYNIEIPNRNFPSCSG